MKHAPQTIEVLFYFYLRRGSHPEGHTAEVNAAIRTMADNGILEPRAEGGCYSVTERGKAWLEMICATPYPAQVWVDPRSKMAVAERGS